MIGLHGWRVHAVNANPKSDTSWSTTKKCYRAYEIKFMPYDESIQTFLSRDFELERLFSSSRPTP